jgi:hypothetical protein
MQVISVAFRMTMCGFGEMETELLGMLEKCGGTCLDFPKKIQKSYRLFNFFRLRRLQLTCSVKEGSWRFFGGSIDTMGYLFIFLLGIRIFSNTVSILEK